MVKSHLFFIVHYEFRDVRIVRLRQKKHKSSKDTKSTCDYYGTVPNRK